MDEERILARERLQIEQIRALDLEELQVEEVDESSDEDSSFLRHGPSSDIRPGGFTFNTALASLHTYLGEVEDTHHRFSFLDGGTILKIPLFYLEGVVLFPGAILPLRIIQPGFLAAVERALNHDDAPCTIGVIGVYSDGARYKFATVGTTAEIRQYRRLEDGSFNVVTKGHQRFRLVRRWIDVERVACGEVQIIEEDVPLKTPSNAVGRTGPLSSMQNHGHSRTMSSNALFRGLKDGDVGSESNSEESYESALSPSERRIHHSVVDSHCDHDSVDELISSDEENVVMEPDFQSCGSTPHESLSIDSWPPGELNRNKNNNMGIGKDSMSKGKSYKGKWPSWRSTDLNQFRTAPKAFWPFWVYRMYDSYYLARRVADKWKQIIGAPNMEALVAKPDLLSFHIASKIPVSESTRQELLELDGVSYRLRREIELLESFDRVRCKTCQTVIARRSDMLVMSSEGPLGAYVNPHGFVHEIMTFFKANDIGLSGRPVKEYSWFPGYAWTIATCATCETQLGWLFTATNRKLKPKSFWAVRSSQVADDTR